MPTILAIESSCDETAVAILGKLSTSNAQLPTFKSDQLEVESSTLKVESFPTLLANQISTQIDLHQPYGGVVPELASRNHLTTLRPLILAALDEAGLTLPQIDAFAATAGPGLASSLLMGNTAAKALALANRKPFIAVNHMEGHLLSPFLGNPDGIRPSVALIVSGGHTMLVHLRAFGDYKLLGRTRDDAAGEAFDKVAKMLSLPYPGGPNIEKAARGGNPSAYDFPRSMLKSGDLAFSFSGLKTAVLYTLQKIPAEEIQPELPNLCASFQQAVVDVLVKKTIKAARQVNEKLVTLSGGVSSNQHLRGTMQSACEEAGLQLAIAEGEHCTDNAAMIAQVALEKLARDQTDPLSADVDPNMALAE
ncbi:MAG: N6-L-threonylcarbamoyladenine synthase [Verrucomicrobiales bacterium]